MKAEYFGLSRCILIFSSHEHWMILDVFGECSGENKYVRMPLWPNFDSFDQERDAGSQRWG